MTQIRAIETRYKGYRFRSRLEARWAVVLDSASVRFEYEPEGYELPNGDRYLPDFYLPDFDTIVEIKPLGPDLRRRLYLAGKIDGDDWRNCLVTANAPEVWTPGIEMPMIGNQICVGPYLSERGHGEQGHAQSAKGHAEGIVDLCLSSIDRADAVFVWWNGSETVGTLVEVGYAKAKGKPIFVASPRGVNVPWFLWDICETFTADSPELAFWKMWDAPDFVGLIPSLSEPLRKLRQIAHKHTAMLFAGSPGDDLDIRTWYLHSWAKAHQFLDILVSPIWKSALKAGRSARFEFGESGAR